MKINTLRETDGDIYLLETDGDIYLLETDGDITNAIDEDALDAGGYPENYEESLKNGGRELIIEIPDGHGGREECAKIAEQRARDNDDIAKLWAQGGSYIGETIHRSSRDEDLLVADAIRKRGQDA